MNVNLISGEIVYTSLKTGMDPKEYETRKCIIWLRMLQEGKEPKTFKRPTKKGTGIKFDFIKSDEQAEKALGDFKTYIDYVNGAFGLELELEGEGS